MICKTWRYRVGGALLSLGLLLLFSGCSDDNPLKPIIQPVPDQDELPDDLFPHELFTDEKSLDIIHQNGDTPPPGLVDVFFGGEQLRFWPYTGMSFDGDPKDPINLLFAGQADPLQIRAVLLALDGDRTAFGFPPVAPFDAIWTDAIGGDVQTTYAEAGHGWVGSVIQLTLGDYEPLRVHLRLFRTGCAFGGEGNWTLGGAHFEVMIPGTADHQVLSWEIAQQLVVADLMRSGLLDPNLPLASTGLINAAPSFRNIPAVIYNGLPPELIALIGGPSQPVLDPVPLASDGEATILNLAGSLPVTPGHYTNSITITYDQVVPKPFCAEGEYDWLYVTGPVDFFVTTRVTCQGRLISRASYHGSLAATPVDISSGEPVPTGEPFPARVSGIQRGFLGEHASRIVAVDRRLTQPVGGPEILITRLVVPQQGYKVYRALIRCVDEEN